MATPPLILLTDFGTRERFVACMKGVIVGVDPTISIYDLTHHIPPFDILEAAIALHDTMPYWPPGSVFVAVVDPGVGTPRRSVVASTTNSHLIVCPDNGLLTLVQQAGLVDKVFVIEQEKHRRPGSEAYHTFHGRDLYAYTGARLAAGLVKPGDLGREIASNTMMIDLPAAYIAGRKIVGTMLRIEYPYGNLVTNIPADMAGSIRLRKGALARIRILHKMNPVYENDLPFVHSFGFVDEGALLLYTDSAGRLGIAQNGGSAAELLDISGGGDIQIEIENAKSH